MSEKSIDFTKGGLRIAVIGGGISGIVASHLISRSNEVVLFERERLLGGHTYTVGVDDGGGGEQPVDIGFIVFNEPNYPVFNRFISELGVERAVSDMSFAYHDPQSGMLYAGTGLRGMLARWSNLVSPPFWKMVSGMRRFSREAREDLKDGSLEGMTIGEYMDRRGHSREFEENYLLPMAGAIWSAPDGRSREFPAEALIRFFDNHMLLDYLDRPQWFYVKGGSRTYVRAFEKRFPGEVRTSTPVSAVTRSDDGVAVTADGRTETFDAVVLATHADVSLGMLTDPTDEERRLLSPWSYAPNRVVLHSDESFMPPKRSAWASWVFIREPERPPESLVGVSYHMNRLQQIASQREYIVTLNPVREPGAGGPIEDVVLDHPQYSLASLRTQAELDMLDGVRRTFFCGAYQGYGFHEDGARSGERVARQFGESL
ncbi:NAD(P)/FAD-dependent oxidoreductase [Salidesulfovibrio brasiliensis]|uniref:NAD(P)/FAD-dependent oxidoreductase n=1 Tax=Salidesulfovibrio brasiliensis TaxID=221711 RepID=UPI0006CFC032|nr:FAD-dependent oxidoreductase [Salidesulfovibrio brasiliensis]